MSIRERKMADAATYGHDELKRGMVLESFGEGDGLRTGLNPTNH